MQLRMSLLVTVNFTRHLLMVNFPPRALTSQVVKANIRVLIVYLLTNADTPLPSKFQPPIAPDSGNSSSLCSFFFYIFFMTKYHDFHIVRYRRLISFSFNVYVDLPPSFGPVEGTIFFLSLSRTDFSFI